MGTTIGRIKGDARSLDYSSCNKPRVPPPLQLRGQQAISRLSALGTALWRLSEVIHNKL